MFAILKATSNDGLCFPFSMFDRYALVIPIFEANASWVICFSFLKFVILFKSPPPNRSFFALYKYIIRF